MAVSFRQSLEELARLFGVQLSYHDTQGRLHVATDDVLVAVLGALGVSIRDERDAEQALERRRASLADRVLSPIVVIWDGALCVVARLRASDVAGSAHVRIDFEDGTSRSFELALRGDAVRHRTDALGVERVDLHIRSSEPIATGYHQLTLRCGEITETARLWSAPTRAYQGPEERGWGLFAPIYSLRSQDSSGIGDFSDLARLCRFVGSRGGQGVATLPLLPTFLDDPYDPSPYAPVSRHFYNELYISLSWLGDDETLAAARAVRDDPSFERASRALGGTESVDYRAAVSHKQKVLAKAADAVLGDADVIRDKEREHPEIAAYARFRAVLEAQGLPPSQWPARLIQGPLHKGDFEPARYRYHFFCQLEAERQMAEVERQARQAGVGLYLDLPLGTHSSGYDAFHSAGELVLGCSVGAPPDDLFEGGQDWGFSPPHPERGSEAGHAMFLACIRHHMRHATSLRIDHVMGLSRLFFIPRGHPATAGVYVEQPAEELYAALCIESLRSQTRLIGEDLGTVPDQTRQSMAEHGMDRLFVLQFQPIPEPGQRGEVPVCAMASLNTHDMPTFFGFWDGADIETRISLGLLDSSRVRAEKAARAAMRERLEHWLASLGYLEPPSTREVLLGAELQYLAESPARTVLVSLGDLTQDRVPHNVPGTGPERGNWTHKATLSLEELETSARIVERLAPLSSRSRSDRVRDAPRSRPSRSVGEADLRLFEDGNHTGLSRVLGAHPANFAGQDGVHFSVWAPGARSVSVVGDFNQWRPDAAPLHRRGGVWECFVPGAMAGQRYRLHVTGADDAVVEKADPMAWTAEVFPKTASVVAEPHYVWSDGAWMSGRKERNGRAVPCAVYEVHLGSFARAEDGALLGFREIAPILADHVADLGFTHVELMPVMEHPTYATLGYQMTGYFGVASRYGQPEDLMFLVDLLHQRGIGVLLDWAPGHFSLAPHGLGRFDGSALYEHADPRQGFHPDWQSPVFDYGRPEVRSFLISSALHWLRELHADGLRLEGVTSMLRLDYLRAPGQWTPNVHGGHENLEAVAFLRQLNDAVYAEFSDVKTVAEEFSAWPLVSRSTAAGGLGFAARWHHGWTRDTLEYFARDPVHRRYHHENLTVHGPHTHHEDFVLPLSHHEVMHGRGSLLSKMPGDDWQRFANLRLLFAYMYAWPGSKLLFMGSELSPWSEWNPHEPLPMHLLEAPLHRGVFETIRRLNRLYRSEPALYELDQEEGALSWVDIHNAEQSVLCFERHSKKGGSMLCVFNFTPVPRDGYRIGVTEPGYFRELLNTDAAVLGGSGVGNSGGAEALATQTEGRSYCLEVTLPPLAALYFKQG